MTRQSNARLFKALGIQQVAIDDVSKQRLDNSILASLPEKEC